MRGLIVDTWAHVSPETLPTIPSRILSPEKYKKVGSIWAMTSEKSLRILRYAWPLWLQFTTVYGGFEEVHTFPR